MTFPLISIIVPVYNVQEYVEDCIRTLLKQTYSKLEIILVDDGSTDESGKICDRYSLEDDRITVIHKENGGLSDARNAGLKIMHGEYVFFVDSDDWLHVETIQILYNNIVKYNCDVAIGNFCRETNRSYEKYIIPVSTDIEVYKLSTKQTLEEMLKQEKYTCSAWGRLYKTTLFEGIEFPKGKLYEDQGTMYKLFLKTNECCFIDFPLYAYYVRTGSIQQSKFCIENMDELEFALEQKKAIDECYPELQGATSGSLVSTCFHIMFGIEDVTEFQEYYKTTRNLILKYRRQVIFDCNTGKKVKIGCIVSYLGFGITRFLYYIADVRGKIIR